MATRLSIPQVLDTAQKVINTWNENPGLTIGNAALNNQITAVMMEALVDEIQADDEEIEKLRTRLTGLVDARDTKVGTLSSYNTRVKSGVRSNFGPDSKQYKQVGGIPTSERKSPVRKPKPTP
ncbi:hypothetical protein [Armatimonas sp.]|uniref:hypothetical protein n=1 Tax=Armatimonas sp. TaxID=1872638 RepID=UPI00286D1270|nr:hypothetical protein [Armatimonas sp.]